MHANELLKRIITRIPHHTEGERDDLLAAVDVAFPVHVPDHDAADDEDQEQGDTPAGTLAPTFKGA